MKRDDITIGMGVAYQAYPGAEREDGIVTEIREHGAMVRYTVNGPAKLTPFDRLTAIGGPH